MTNQSKTNVFVSCKLCFLIPYFPLFQVIYLIVLRPATILIYPHYLSSLGWILIIEISGLEGTILQLSYKINHFHLFSLILGCLYSWYTRHQHRSIEEIRKSCVLTCIYRVSVSRIFNTYRNLYLTCIHIGRLCIYLSNKCFCEPFLQLKKYPERATFFGLRQTPSSNILSATLIGLLSSCDCSFSIPDPDQN